MLYRYKIGKQRLKEIWGVNVVATPNALAGSIFLYEHPEARAENLMWALQNNFIHRTSMTVIPMGAMAEIDCGCAKFSILESGVAENEFGR